MTKSKVPAFVAISRADADTILDALTNPEKIAIIPEAEITRLSWLLAGVVSAPMHAAIAIAEDGKDALGDGAEEAFEAIHSAIADSCDEFIADMERDGISLEHEPEEFLRIARAFDPQRYHHLGAEAVADAFEARFDGFTHDPGPGTPMFGLRVPA